MDPGNGSTCNGVAAPARFQRALELLQSASDRELLSIRSQERITEVSGPLRGETATASAAADAAREGLELQPRADGKSWALTRRGRRLVVEVTPGAEREPELLELEGLLNLRPGQPQYDLVVAPGRVPDALRHPSPASAELRITPRSTEQVYFFLANGVEVPPEHVSPGSSALPQTGPATR
jgi:hypothetical protein